MKLLNWGSGKFQIDSWGGEEGKGPVCLSCLNMTQAERVCVEPHQSDLFSFSEMSYGFY